MTTVKWLPDAHTDLRRLYEFIEPHSPRAAAKALETLIAEAGKLADFPERGRPWGPDHQYREWPVRFGAKGYVIRYRLHEDDVIIVRVWHALEDR